MFARWLVFLLGVWLFNFSYAQTPPPFPQFSALKSASPDDSWIINEKSRLGYRSRINVTRGQDPFPYCFSVAATLLWDQHRCQQDRKDCSTQERTSFLAVTSVGQQLPNTALSHSQGGAALFSLSRIVDQGGAASHSVCNYDSIEYHRTPYGHVVNNMYQISKQWQKYKDYTPYLERVHRRSFRKISSKLNPTRSLDELDLILNNSGTKSIDQLFAEIVLNENCFVNNFVPDHRFEIKRLKMGDVFNSKLTFDTIDQLLRKNIPVMITFCVNPEAKIPSCVKHAAVVIARANAVNQITGDVRTVFWIANTWSEEWQKAYNDGWIFAENFINSAFGEIIWLETKKQ